MTIDKTTRAEVLMEALPYIQSFAGQTVVIKYGGHAMVDEKLKECFARNVIMLRAVGIYPIVVHGGGPQIGKVLEKLCVECRFEQGMRVTSPEVMDVVQMVLVGQVNTGIVQLISNNGGKAVGLNGHDGRLIQAERMMLEKKSDDEGQPPEIIDIGQVGRPVDVNATVLHTLEHGQFIPVIAPVGVGPNGESLNINADLVAGAVASKVRASKLIMMTDTPGVLDGQGNLITEMSQEEVRRCKEEGIIKGGMIPKVDTCVSALEAGVERAHIIDGRVPNALILEIFTDLGVGTIIKE